MQHVACKQHLPHRFWVQDTIAQMMPILDWCGSPLWTGTLVRFGKVTTSARKFRPCALVPAVLGIRQHRSFNSPWQPYGAKKRARTQRWAATPELKFFRQVLYDNNISLKDMHDILVWYFKQEARYDAAEDSVWPFTGEHNASRQPPL